MTIDDLGSNPINRHASEIHSFVGSTNQIEKKYHALQLRRLSSMVANSMQLENSLLFIMLASHLDETWNVLTRTGGFGRK